MLVIIDNTVNQSVAMYLPLLLKYLTNKQVPFVVCKTLSQLQSLNVKKISGFILSGSPLMVTTKDFTDNLDQFILNMYVLMNFHDLPILGICFGYQIITKMFGGSLQKLKTPFCDENEIRFRKGKLQARFCCSYIMQDIPKAFKEVAWTTIENNTIACMIRHRTLPIFCCLFHPEYLAQTHFILDNFIALCKVPKNKI